MKPGNFVIIILSLIAFLNFTMCSSGEVKGKELITLIENDDYQKALALLNSNPDLAQKNKEGRSALALAFEKAQVSLIQVVPGQRFF